MFFSKLLTFDSKRRYFTVFLNDFRLQNRIYFIQFTNQKVIFLQILNINIFKFDQLFVFLNKRLQNCFWFYAFKTIQRWTNVFRKWVCFCKGFFIVFIGSIFFLDLIKVWDRSVILEEVFNLIDLIL